MKNLILYYKVLFDIIGVVGLVVAQWLMDVPSSGGDITTFCKHTLGIWLAFFVGAFYSRSQR